MVWLDTVAIREKKDWGEGEGGLEAAAPRLLTNEQEQQYIRGVRCSPGVRSEGASLSTSL